MRQGNNSIKHIVIVGGGSAGWITAGLLASQHPRASGGGVDVTVIESPDVATIGVGEGTWPTMRSTLQKIGLDEAEFLETCEASPKQGTRFHGWVNGGEDDVYYHPFSVPAGYPNAPVVPYWQAYGSDVRFAQSVSAQAQVCDHGLAPKLPSIGPNGPALNYGYHLNAGRFADLLKTHCIERLGVAHVLAHVQGIDGGPDENIKGLRLANGETLEGDLFVDCTGQAAMLIEGHYGIGLSKQDHILFNDRAWAAQVPYASQQSAIQSQTNATAQKAGWVWDIGLTSRRGIGHVFSSAHSSDEEALEVLWEYLRDQAEVDLSNVSPRLLSFEPGYRERFWHRNCVAVGMSAGFIEPLEASALVMVELAAQRIAEELPPSTDTLDLVAARFNELFGYRWARIIDFIKLHYVLSQRDDTAYWRDHRDAKSIPVRLQELLRLWAHQVPSPRDFPQIDEIFSAASYQYVLYGMGFKTAVRPSGDQARQDQHVGRLLDDVARQARQLTRDLPDNRTFQWALHQARSGQLHAQGA